MSARQYIHGRELFFLIPIPSISFDHFIAFHAKKYNLAFLNSNPERSCQYHLDTTRQTISRSQKELVQK